MSSLLDKIIEKRPVAMAQIKESLCREDIAEILESAGFEVTRDYKLSLREERTPSASISPDGYIKDFGDGWGGDIFDVLSKYKNLTIKEAKDIVLRRSPIKEKRTAVNNNTVSSYRLEEEFLGFSETIPDDELFQVVPKWLYQSASPIDKSLFDSMTRYDTANRTLVTGCYDNTLFELKMIGYKRRRLNGLKWANRKDTHPNGTLFKRIYSENETIFVIEGHHDCLTAILLGLDFIMIPTASYKGQIDGISNRNIVFIVEDKPAYDAMLPLAQSLATNNNVELKQLSTFEKMDLSDFVQNYNSINEAKNGIKG